MTGFASMAETYVRHGMAVIPCTGKRPLVRWQKMSQKTTARLLPRWREDHADANVGLLTGQSNLTVIDIDTADTSIVTECERRFGQTPVVARTPRGGTHLFFRSSGERTTAKLGGQPIDVRGLGGFLVVPPSARADGRRYEFIRGSVEDLKELPAVKPGSVSGVGRFRPTPIAEGKRNDTLFRLAMKGATNCETLGELLARLEILNESQCSPPLDQSEVEHIAASAWRYQLRGQNWVDRGWRVFASHSEIDDLVATPDALALLLFLRRKHLRERQAFIVAPRAMATKGPLSEWTERRLRKARSTLVNAGLLVLTQGGGITGQASEFRFGDPLSPLAPAGDAGRSC
jgi:hypothetical protein